MLTEIPVNCRQRFLLAATLEAVHDLPSPRLEFPVIAWASDAPHSVDAFAVVR